MKKQDIVLIRDFARSVGHFIRYWGFRNIHGQIWATVYLSREPLSGIEIVKILGVSKALVSPALKELETEGLLKEVASENGRVKRFAAVENVGDVIKRVLKSREQRLLQDAHSTYSKIKVDTARFVDPKRFHEVGDLIQVAQLGLQFLTESQSPF